MINIWFMAAKVVLVLTESSLLHCSIFPVPPSQRNTVRTWIFYFLQGQHVFATFCTRSVSNLFHFCQYDLSIRLLSSSIPKRSLLLCYLSAWTPSAEMSFWECLATFFSDFLLWEFWKVQAQFPYWERIQMWWYRRYIWTMEIYGSQHLSAAAK